MNPGGEIRRLRLAHGVSQGSLARRAGTTQATVSLIERGLSSPRWETLAALLLALGYEAELAPRRLQSRADPVHLAALRERDPAERLALAVSANRLAGRLREAGSDALG